MEVLEKPRTTKTRKKRDKQKDREQHVGEPVASCSNNIDIPTELLIAANDTEDIRNNQNNETNMESNVCNDKDNLANTKTIVANPDCVQIIVDEVIVSKNNDSIEVTGSDYEKLNQINVESNNSYAGIIVDNEQKLENEICKLKQSDDVLEDINSSYEINDSYEVATMDVQCNNEAVGEIMMDNVTELRKEICNEAETKNNESNKIINLSKYEDLNQQLKEITEIKTTQILATAPLEIIETPKIIKAYTESQLSALYTNTELDALEDFTKEFVEAELKGIAIKQHTLYDLLISYLQVRTKSMSVSLEIQQSRKDYQELQNQLWSLSSSVVKETALCLDRNLVTATHTFTKATFHRSCFKSIMRMLGKIRELTNETNTLYTYSAQVLKVQIELYIQTLINNIVDITQLSPNAPIFLGMQSPPHHLLPYLSDLRLCISILFQFQRKLIRDAQFVKETRAWLTDLVCLLLRLSSWQDHLFILNHVLRCPAGVGSWASCFIQVPIPDNITDSPFSSYEVNHAITTLALLLTPVIRREQFLDEISQKKDAPVDALWVMVDSDGEEDEESSGTSLRENDLVALLNQLPLEMIFRTVLQFKHQDNKDVYDSTKITEYHILRFLSFSTTLLKLVRRGLRTYDQPRYNQFCKRLSRFIRHIVQYATDQWEYFQKGQNLDDKAMMVRLQVEYDAFFLRAICYLYTSEKLGAWQFLAVVPYGLVSERTLWKIFYFLHGTDRSSESILDPIDDTDYSDKIWETSFRDEFEEKLGLLAEDECYYLLNTFANMALARNVDNIKFIYTATMDLLQIGFVSEATQEACSKNARILLTHITSKHPFLLSDILKAVKENMFKIGYLSLYMYEELPIANWRPTDADIGLISNWLTQNSITSNESKLARMILSRLNWSFVDDGLLFLPYGVHCKIALLIAKVVELDPGYLPWAWQTSFRLRLHITDKGFTDFQLVKDLEHFDTIFKGVFTSHQPLASFLSVLISSWGHLIPLVCTRGFDQLLFLQTHQKHEAVLFALNLIVPLFLNCQESVINLEKFQTIILGLLNADRTYINIAKSLVGSTSTILEQFGNMIESQIANFKWYDLDSPRCVVRLWANSLVSVPNWNRDYGVMYLLNAIIRASFFHSDALLAVTNILKELLQCSTPQEQTNSISSLFKWVSQSNASQNNLLINTSLSTCPWLAYVMISLEFDEREKNTGIWNEILIQLKHQKGKGNVDVAIKKAASKLKVPAFTSGSLCIFRWAQQALDTSVDHPILVLLWQKFFSLYLYRVPLTGTTDRGCVGDKFFDGLINFNFLKRLKRCLQESVDHYKSKTTEEEFEDLSPEKKMFYTSLFKIFTAYSLWLEEPRLQEAYLYLPGLPPQYEPHFLNLVMQFSDIPWYESVNYDMIKQQQTICIKTWRCANYREYSKVNQPLPNAGGGVESTDPIERISRRLKSYDCPKSAPPIKTIKTSLPPLNLENKKTMFVSLDRYFRTMLQFAHNYNLSSSEHKALDCGYQELIPQLYRSVINKIEKNVACSGTNKSIHCTGSAKIILQTQEARINEHIEHQIQSNRTGYDSLISKFLQDPSHFLCEASLIIQEAIYILQKLRTPEQREAGVELFYYILSLINEESSQYLPTKKLFTECLERLGQSHINGVEFETPRLLNKILDDPVHGMFLAPHFSPANVGTANFLLMYSTISKGIGEKYDLLYSLLSKFDIHNWLIVKNPKLSQRSQFIEQIMQSLLRLGQEPPHDAQMLHEVYRKHLILIFEYQFPEHYGEILMCILKASNGGTETGCVSISVWMDILNCLSKPIQLQLTSNMREQLRQYSQHQQVLHYQELLDTAILLSRHFTNERLQYGLYGLYPKTRNYIDVIVLFLGMAGHSLIISALNTHQGVLGDKLCEIIWPYLRDMFAPWIVPYWTNTIKENMATWMQQLTDDRSVLLPWIPANAPFAQKAVNMFFECILFIIQTLPACNNILSFVWHWYVTNFAHTTFKDHILNVIHQSFVSLPWHKFWPTIADLELMLKVVDQYLPECHSFLGHIFMEIPWLNWLNSLSENTSLQLRQRVHHCILHLLVKLSNEPNVRNNYAEKAKSLLVQAENFDWIILDGSSVQQAMDWYVMSSDPIVILKSDPLHLDYRVIQFLKSVCNYTTNNHEQNTLEKRHIFIQGYVKLIVLLTSRHKALVLSKEMNLLKIINVQLNHMELLVDNQMELNCILGELLTILNVACITRPVLTCFEQWLSNKEGDGMIIKAVFQVLGSHVTDMDAAASVYETCINSYFQNNVTNIDNLSWTEVANLLKQYPPKQSELIESLIAKGCLLTLHTIILQKLSNCKDYQTLLNISMEWLNNIKITENTETKVPLIWVDILRMCQKFCDLDEPMAAAVLYKFAQFLIQTAKQNNPTKWDGILGVIGIGKQAAISLNFRFLCRALGGYILAQLPDKKGCPQSVRNSANASCPVGQAGGNSEVVKVLLKLDFTQSQGKIKECAELALREIQDPKNSIYNVGSFLSLLLIQLYTKPYYIDIG